MSNIIYLISKQQGILDNLISKQQAILDTESVTVSNIQIENVCWKSQQNIATIDKKNDN